MEKTGEARTLGAKNNPPVRVQDFWDLRGSRSPATEVPVRRCQRARRGGSARGPGRGKEWKGSRGSTVPGSPSTPTLASDNLGHLLSAITQTPPRHTGFVHYWLLLPERWSRGADVESADTLLGQPGSCSVTGMQSQWDSLRALCSILLALELGPVKGQALPQLVLKLCSLRREREACGPSSTTEALTYQRSHKEAIWTPGTGSVGV